ncbi:MAG: metallophosphoesterase [Planctomycetota bacterium]
MPDPSQATPLIEPYELRHPAVPPRLDGFRLLHLSDLHTRHRDPARAVRTPLVRRLLAELAAVEVDLVCLTGDETDSERAAPAAMAVVRCLAEAWRSRLGAVAVFGNHDRRVMRRLADRHQRTSPSIRWLDADGWQPQAHDLPLRIVGTSYPEDALGAHLRANEENTHDDRLTLALAHHPAGALAHAVLGAHIVVSGHTHGGQLRPHRRLGFYTSSDLPHRVAWGIVRAHNALLCISRGLGTTGIHARINCPPHAPLFTLRRGPMPKSEQPDARTAERDRVLGVQRVLAW